MSLYSAIALPSNSSEPAAQRGKSSLYHDAPEMAKLPDMPLRHSASESAPQAQPNAALQFAPPRRRPVARASRSAVTLAQKDPIGPSTAPTRSSDSNSSYAQANTGGDFRSSKKRKTSHARPHQTYTINWRASYDPRRPTDLSDWLQSDERLDELDEWQIIKERRLANKQPEHAASQSPPAYAALAPASSQRERAVSPQAQAQAQAQAQPIQNNLAPGQKGFAARYMAAQGWKKGQGLGSTGHGRLAPLFVRPHKDGTGQVIDKERERLRGRQSKVVLLTNLIKAGEAVDEMLQQDIGDACTTNYGPVERVQIDWRAGTVQITFRELADAVQCVSSIGSRLFWGETVHAAFAAAD